MERGNGMADHNLKEFRIFGGPGCAKTTSAAKQIKRAVEKYGPDMVLCSSMTRTAAREIANRDTGVDENNVGTLHSLCYRRMEKPKIAETIIGEFNEAHPEFYIGKGGGKAETSMDDGLFFDPSSVTQPGDEAMTAYNLFRSRLHPRSEWPVRVQRFADVWADFKTQTHSMDFTDLLEHALNWTQAPSGCKVAFIDEAQDLSALQFKLVRHWSQYMESLVFLGDDDQAIYDFAGGDPSHLYNDDIPEENKFFLKQSYRLPRNIYIKALEWIDGCSNRQKKFFDCRNDDGEVINLKHSHWRAPQGIIQHIRDDVDAGRSVMILAACTFMLPPIINEMRDEGMMFHNPYRKSQGAWNPLSAAKGSASARLALYWKTDPTGLSPEWTHRELELFTGVIKTKGVLKRGAKKQIAALAKAEPDARATDLVKYFEPGVLMDAWPPTLDWIRPRILDSKHSSMQFPLRIIDEHGVKGLTATPKITVGTIHSVKGGEADSVYLFPDISRDAAVAWGRRDPETVAQRDSIRRVFYVGMTRARHKLTLIPPHGPLHVKL